MFQRSSTLKGDEYQHLQLASSIPVLDDGDPSSSPTLVAAWGQVQFMPDPNYHGTDELLIRVTDGEYVSYRRAPLGSPKR